MFGHFKNQDYDVKFGTLKSYRPNPKTVTLPEGITVIGNQVFAHKDKLKEVTLPEGLKVIGPMAFLGCYNLETVNLPKSLKRIENGAFGYCPKLKKITLLSDLEIADCCFSDLEHVTVAEGVTVLPSGIFRKNKIEEVVLPTTIKRIGAKAFAESPLKTINLPEGLESIEDGAFYHTELCEITLPESLQEIGEEAFCRTKFKKARWPSGVSEIKAGTFRYADISEIELANTLTTIGDSAFEASDLLKVTLPPSIEAFGKDVFRNCKKLTEFIFPDKDLTLSSQGGWAFFNGCHALETVHLPDKLTVIPSYLFNECADLKTVNLPDSLQKLGESAFSSCTSLTEITLPQGLGAIEESTFRSCRALTAIAIPDSIKTVGKKAFSGCESLTAITLPDGIKEFGDEAFANCKKLESITLPKTLEKIGHSAFSGCYALKTVVLPDTVKAIDSRAFAFCYALTSLTLPEGLEVLGGDIFTDCTDLVLDTSALSEEQKTKFADRLPKSDQTYTVYFVTDPNDPDASSYPIGGYYKERTVALKKVTLTKEEFLPLFQSANTYRCLSEGSHYTEPNAARKISPDEAIFKDGVFWGIVTLYHDEGSYNDRTWEWESEPFSAPIAIQKNGEAASVDDYSHTLQVVNTVPEPESPLPYPQFTIEYGVLWAANLGDITEVVIPDGVQKIAERVFQRNEAITSITIPSSVKVIDSYAFYDCKNLTNVFFADGLEIIKSYAFYGCPLAELNLPNTVKELGFQSFAYCDGDIKTLTVPGSLKTIDAAFWNWPKLETVILKEGIEELHYAFSGCRQLKTVQLPESLKILGSANFRECDALGMPHLPNNLVTIGERAFFGLSKLTEITLPASVKTVGKEAFAECKALKTVVLTATETVGEAAFAGCSALESVSLPKVLELIEKNAFAFCEALTRVEISEGLTALPEKLFLGCSALTSLTLPDSLQSVEKDSFLLSPVISALQYAESTDMPPDLAEAIRVAKADPSTAYIPVWVACDKTAVGAEAYPWNSNYAHYSAGCLHIEAMSVALFDKVKQEAAGYVIVNSGDSTDSGPQTREITPDTVIVENGKFAGILTKYRVAQGERGIASHDIVITKHGAATVFTPYNGLHKRRESIRKK